MKRCLIIINLLLLLGLLPCHATGMRMVTNGDSDSLEYHEYHLTLTLKQNEMTGICMMNISANHDVVGTIVNEFGVKILDFTYTNGATKLVNIIKPLNKWYIRKVLKGDFHFILTNMEADKDVAVKKRKLSVAPNGNITVRNELYKICYLFTPILKSDETH